MCTQRSVSKWLVGVVLVVVGVTGSCDATDVTWASVEVAPGVYVSYITGIKDLIVPTGNKEYKVGDVSFVYDTAEHIWGWQFDIYTGLPEGVLSNPIFLNDSEVVYNVLSSISNALPFPPITDPMPSIQWPPSYLYFIPMEGWPTGLNCLVGTPEPVFGHWGWGCNLDHWIKYYDRAMYAVLHGFNTSYVIVGTEVPAWPTDPTTGTEPVGITFTNVTVAGTATVVSAPPSEDQDPPPGFMAGDPPTVFNIETTATYTGAIQVQFDYSAITYVDESALALFHFQDDEWVDITTSVDTVNNLIYGVTTSLSPFAVFELDTQNQPPVAVCQEDVVAVGEMPNIDAGSYDPDGDAITAVVSPGAFYEAGIHYATLTVTDPYGASDTCTAMVVAYDPSAGFVTGGGWIDSPVGAYTPGGVYSPLTGKANFGFVAKYKKGANVPDGQTEFVFKAGDLNFHSSSYDWLVVTGSDYAKFKGTGTINGFGAYKFQIWAQDGAPDKFRIKIWTEDAFGVETVEYDNGMEQPIGGGSIVIHTK